LKSITFIVLLLTTTGKIELSYKNIPNKEFEHTYYIAENYITIFVHVY